MRALICCVTLFLMSALALPVEAEELSFVDGNQLKDWCEADGDDTDTLIQLTLCRGFIDGAFETIWSLAVKSGIDMVNCIPSNVSDEQIADIVQAYIRDNPAERHKLAFMLVGDAVLEAFPECKEN